MKEYTIDDIKNIVRHGLGKEIPLLLFRTLHIMGMRSILGETAGATLYMMGKNVGKMLPAKIMDYFKKVVQELKVGIPEAAIIDEDHITVKLHECITCGGFANTGEMFCDMESGIIARLLENVCDKKTRSTQTKSWSSGFNHCEFEVFLY